MNKIEIYEVGPRDGFQNVKEYIPLETKLKVIEGLVAAGVKHLQITSFVSPKAIPQMRDAKKLTDYCRERYPEADLFALVPNLRGAQAADEAGLSWVSYVASLSESHNRANIRRSHRESFEQYLRIREALPDLEVCLDLSTAFGCPFEGRKEVGQIVEFLAPYAENGLGTVNLCDTIGIANPAQVRAAVRAVGDEFPDINQQIHIHDTRNMGMVNTLAAIECGVTGVQSTLGGLGGCPYAPGASGNLATEDLVFMLSEMGYETGIAAEMLIRAAREQVNMIPQGKYSGHLFRIEEVSSVCMC